MLMLLWFYHFFINVFVYFVNILKNLKKNQFEIILLLFMNYLMN